MADIASNRLAFALRNEFADETVGLVSGKPSSVESGLACAKEDAATMVGKNKGEKFSRTFECTGAEACVRTAIYVSHAGGAYASNKNPPSPIHADFK
jgi:L-iditol 2-dehydrogenase